MKTTRWFSRLAAAAAIAAASASGAYPEKAIRIVVPFPAGGASDAAARAVGQGLAKSLAQPVVIENRPGASGAIAAQAVHAAAPDGYTLLWAPASMVSLPALMRSPPFSSLADFSPVAGVGELPFCLFVHPQVPAGTAAELAAYARANPSRIQYGSGSISEMLAGEQFARSSGAKLEQVPYKGGAQLMPDLVAGRVQVNIGPCSTAMSFVNAGKLRVLATLLPARSALLPDVPTAAEAGMPELSAPTWQALLAPPRTPKEIVERLARELAESLKDPETLAQFGKIGVQPEFAGPAALEARIRTEMPAWSRFVKLNGIEAE